MLVLMLIYCLHFMGSKWIKTSSAFKNHHKPQTSNLNANKEFSLGPLKKYISAEGALTGGGALSCTCIA